MMRRPLSLLSIALVAAGFAIVARTRANSDGERSIQAGGLTRTYLVHRPASARPNAPLVVVLHGGFGTGAQAERDYHFDEVADRDGFIVAYPDGVRRAWNAGTCCGKPHEDGVDDVAFLNGVVAAIERDEGTNPHRVFFTGMSNGAFMSYRMACESTLPIAAIAPVAGTIVTPCERPQATSVLAIHGIADPLVPFAGGHGLGVAGRDRDLKSVPASVAVFSRADACGVSTKTTSGPVTDETWSCGRGAAVELISVADAGHQWPGSRPMRPGVKAILDRLGIPLSAPSTALDATGAIAAFFASRPSTP